MKRPYGLPSFPVATLPGLMLLLLACSSAQQSSVEGLSDYALFADEDVESIAQGLSGNLAVGTVVMATANLNLRTGPGTNSDILRTMAMNSAMKVERARPNAGFYYVRHGNMLGWASGSYLDVSHAPLASSSAARIDMADVARSAIGFSYWWGHARWTVHGATGPNAGTCRHDAGSYFHEGDYGADCSGLVSKAWQIPGRNTSTMEDIHGPGTARYAVDEVGAWHTIAMEDALLADAMVRRRNGAGHIFLVADTYDDGVITYECRGCDYGCVSVKRPWTELVQAGYHAIRKDDFL